MRDRNHIDWNVWLDTYKDTFASFSKAQQEGFRALERLARFHYAVAGDVLEAGLAQAKATLGARAALGPVFGTQAFADLVQQQTELGTQLSEKLRERVQEFSALAAEVQESVGSFAAAAAKHNGRAHAAMKAA